MDYDAYAEQLAEVTSGKMSARVGLALHFNGYARGPNIYLETADVATTKWAAINNPLNQLGRDYAPIRRSKWRDEEARFKVCNFVIPNNLSHPDYPAFLRPVDAWLHVNSNVISDLVAQNQLWVGDSPWKMTSESKNIDEFKELEKDYYWTEESNFKLPSSLPALTK